MCWAVGVAQPVLGEVVLLEDQVGRLGVSMDPALDIQVATRALVFLPSFACAPVSLPQTWAAYVCLKGLMGQVLPCTLCGAAHNNPPETPADVK